MEIKYIVMGIMIIALVLVGCVNQVQKQAEATAITTQTGVPVIADAINPVTKNGNILTFSWKSLPNAGKYLIIIYTSQQAQANGEPPVASGITTETSITSDKLLMQNQLVSGQQYYLIIAATTADYQIGQSPTMVSAALPITFTA